MSPSPVIGGTAVPSQFSNTPVKNTTGENSVTPVVNSDPPLNPGFPPPPPPTPPPTGPAGPD